ncbi:MAG: sensor histidine kinase, partial [Lachnospiraceae bacterium]|nr:sensor histidine kinase [Lachnospiraceae bacterium]
RKQAEKKKILWECHVQIPKSCSIDEMDLCVLFGNLLDNAVKTQFPTWLKI